MRLALGGALLLVAACTGQPTITQSPPPGGLTADQAIAAAALYAPAGHLVSTQAGPFWAVMGASSRPPGPSIEDQWVWAITYAGNIRLRDGAGGALSPQPGTTTLYLDYFSGTFLDAGIEASSSSPAD